VQPFHPVLFSMQEVAKRIIIQHLLTERLRQCFQFLKNGYLWKPVFTSKLKFLRQKFKHEKNSDREI